MHQTAKIHKENNNPHC